MSVAWDCDLTLSENLIDWSLAGFVAVDCSPEAVILGRSITAKLFSRGN